MCTRTQFFRTNKQHRFTRVTRNSTNHELSSSGAYNLNLITGNVFQLSCIGTRPFCMGFETNFSLDVRCTTVYSFGYCLPRHISAIPSCIYDFYACWKRYRACVYSRLRARVCMWTCRCIGREHIAVVLSRMHDAWSLWCSGSQQSRHKLFNNRSRPMSLHNRLA